MFNHHTPLESIWKVFPGSYNKFYVPKNQGTVIFLSESIPLSIFIKIRKIRKIWEKYENREMDWIWQENNSALIFRDIKFILRTRKGFPNTFQWCMVVNIALKTFTGRNFDFHEKSWFSSFFEPRWQIKRWAGFWTKISSKTKKNKKNCS